MEQPATVLQKHFPEILPAWVAGPQYDVHSDSENNGWNSTATLHNFFRKSWFYVLCVVCFLYDRKPSPLPPPDEIIFQLALGILWNFVLSGQTCVRRSRGRTCDRFSEHVSVRLLNRSQRGRSQCELAWAAPGPLKDKRGNSRHHGNNARRFHTWTTY